MPTAKVNVLLQESDEVSRREIRDPEIAESYNEKYDGLVTLDADALDVVVSPPQITSGKLLVLTATAGVTVKLNSAVATPMLNVKMLVLDATGISSFFFSNPGEADAKVRISLYE